MAADLAAQPRTDLNTQLCGDAHLSNFGVYAAPDRSLVFDVNDFDETLPGPFEWDLKRLVTSFAIAGRDRGFGAKAARGRQPRGRPRVPRGDVATCGRAQPRPLVLARPRRGDPRARGRGRNEQAAQARREEHRQGAVEGQPQGLRQADRDRQRRAADPQRPAGRSSRSTNSSTPSSTRRWTRRSSTLIRSLPRDAARRPPAPARALPLRRRRPQGRRCRQRRHARLDHAAARTRQRRSAVPAVQGGRGVGARALPRRERVRAATASASSRASD